MEVMYPWSFFFLCFVQSGPAQKLQVRGSTDATNRLFRANHVQIISANFAAKTNLSHFESLQSHFALFPLGFGFCKPGVP